MTTLLILTLMVAVFVLAVELIHTKAVLPITNLFYVESVSVNLLEILLLYGTGALVWAVVMLAVNHFVFVRSKRIIERHKEATELQYLSLVANIETYAEELRQQGIILKTVPVEVAEAIREREERESND